MIEYILLIGGILLLVYVFKLNKVESNKHLTKNKTITVPKSNFVNNDIKIVKRDVLSDIKLNTNINADRNKWLYPDEDLGKMEKGFVFESKTYIRDIDEIETDFKIKSSD